MHSNEELKKIDSILHVAGLMEVTQQFPEDVLAAVHAANRVRAALQPPVDNAEEPWPPMRVRGTPCTG